MADVEPKNRCGLYLCVTAQGAAANTHELIAPLLDTRKVECLLIAPAHGDGNIKDALALCGAAKARSITVLVRDDAPLARTIKAHGVHISWHKDILARYKDARETVGSNAIVGADAGRSRHDAMCLGDLNADYIAFGIPAHVGDLKKARDRQLDLAQWWGEIFEIPMVAFDVSDLSHARTLAVSGVDFVACDLPPGITGPALKDWFDTRVAALSPDEVGA